MIRHGKAPYLECSSAGDLRFSAFSARLQGREQKTIEELYQSAKIFADGSVLPWRAAKGRRPANVDQCRALYAQLWDEYLAENPDLLSILTSATGLSDLFGQSGRACQATELWRIRCAAIQPFLSFD